MKFKVGDRVQFKTWKEMEKEYGIDKDGDITPDDDTISFVRPMRFLCGAFATVERIERDIIYLKDISVKNTSNWDWNFAKFMFKPANTDKYELHIMSDGKKTTAVYKKNGEVVSRSEANLHPDDEFDFKTGAKLAFDRVFHPEPEKKESKKVLRLFDGCGNCYGIVGTPTKYKDVYGRPLFVGDIVEIENAFRSLQFVGEDDIDGAYILGIQKACDPKTGTVRDWKITLVTPFTEVKDGTEAGSLTCRLK